MDCNRFSRSWRRRAVTALVFAAKSDGHIDDQERGTSEQNIYQSGYGLEAERLIQKAMNPQWLATDVKNEEEALELYFLSCAAIGVDHSMGRSYLSALGDALNTPQDVRDGIQQDPEAEKARLPAS